ncbi:DUF1453 domain-containing protein [Saccharopolyspora gloriosae]|uniref:DUF1453 domain-containing protein n=1 Tax=Saccharopolyspora gloriosae TaxID=455344 RepID=UPI001FB66025|nr:DUF1453 domain-containing protein [Saccharopolyspora gloriosae]
MSGSAEGILIIAAVGYVLIRRFLGEPLEGKRMLLLPAVLAGIGVVHLIKAPQPAVSIGFLIATAALVALLGVLRGISARVFERDCLLMMRYTGTTLVLWVINLGVEVGSEFLLGQLDPQIEQSASSMFTIGIGLLAEGIAVLAKGVRTEGPIMWAKGRRSKPDRMSPLLDCLQRAARTDQSPMRDLGSFATRVGELRNSARAQQDADDPAASARRYSSACRSAMAGRRR